MKEDLLINTRTTGFASPAETYTTKRLSIDELVIKDAYTTFYFVYKGPNFEGIKKDDILVVDRSILANQGDLIVVVENDSFKIKKYSGDDNFWGKIEWTIKKV